MYVATWGQTSEECGMPAKNVVQDAAEKSVGTLSILGDTEKESQKAMSSAERGRMLQQAELKALQKTALFQKLDADTKNPEKMQKRKTAIEEITARNDIGASRAPWTPLPENERPPPIKLSMPSMPSLPNPFGGGSKESKPDQAAAKAKKAAPAPATNVAADDDNEEDYE